MPEVVLISILLSVALAVLAGVHVYWALGGSAGKGAAIPEAHGKQLFRPSRAATVGVAGGLALAAVVAAMRGGVFGPAGDHLAWRLAAGVLGVLFAARAVGERRYVGVFKRVRGTRFARWDTRVFTPLCALMAAGFLVLCYVA